MNNYFRITGYHPAKNVCFIADSNGRFKEIWEFSAYLIGKGVKVLEVGNDTKFKYGNIEAAETDSENIIIRACAKGQPTYIGNTVDINGKSYIPK
ncbi:MAG: hypothetical protein HFK06_01645 [Clostridia bacterium]|nr:hypothetical protein [Clostridia bacterium]